MYKVVLATPIGIPVGEVTHFSEFQWFNALSKLATVSFVVGMSTPHLARLAACDGVIKVYRRGQIVFAGPIISSEIVVDRENKSIRVNCVDFAWYLGKRLVGKSATGTLWNTATNRADIVDSLLTTVNTEAWTGVTMASPRSAGSAVTYKAGPYVPLLNVIQELGNALDGFDWQFVPIENYNDGVLTTAGGPSQVVWGGLVCLTVKGVNRPGAVFEYGPNTRGNIVSWSMNTTRDGQATRVYHLKGQDIRFATNATALSYWSLLEDIVSGEFSDTNMRQQLLEEHAKVRGNPRTLIKFTPHIDPGDTGHVPEPWVDYFPGDTVTARFRENNIILFSGLLRVYATRISVDTSGFERVELILEDES